MVDMNAITKPPWPDPLSRPHRKPPDQASLFSLTLTIAANAKLLVFSVNRGGSSSLSSGLGFFFYFLLWPVLKGIGYGILLLVWFDFGMDFFFVGSWWWSWGLPWFGLILILWVAGVCGWGFWGFKKTTVWVCSSWWWWRWEQVGDLGFCFYLGSDFWDILFYCIEILF